VRNNVNQMDCMSADFYLNSCCACQATQGFSLSKIQTTTLPLLIAHSLRGQIKLSKESIGLLQALQRDGETTTAYQVISWLSDLQVEVSIRKTSMRREQRTRTTHVLLWYVAV
jgi:hypothetical protein